MTTQESNTEDDATTYDHPISSTEYKFEDACSLFDPKHGVSGEIAGVLDAIEDVFADVDVSACGCGSCYVSETTVSVFYTAQSPGTQSSTYLKFDCDDDADVTREGVAYAIVGVAKQLGVPVEWEGDASKAVKVGE